MQVKWWYRQRKAFNDNTNNEKMTRKSDFVVEITKPLE